MSDPNTQSSADSGPVRRPLLGFKKLVFWLDQRVVRNIWIETGSSILVLATFFFAVFRPNAFEQFREMRELKHASEFIEATIKLLFLWIVFARIVRFFSALRRLKRKRTTRTFTGATKRYKRAVKLCAQSFPHQGITYTFRKAGIADIDELTDLGHEAWDIDAHGNVSKTKEEREAYFKELLRCNERTFSLVYEHQDVVGYVSVMPMNAAKHFAGQKSQYDFKAADNDIKAEGCSQLIYLQAVYLKNKYRNRPGQYIALINCLLHDIAAVTEDLSKTVLYAEQFTEDGEALLGKMGFQRLYRKSGASRPKPFWELCLDADAIPYDCEFRHNSLITINGIKKWKERLAAARTQ